jgi:predicted RNA-binding protein with RPS1 domain
LSPGSSTGSLPILTECISSSRSYGCSGDTIETTATGLIALAEIVKSFVQNHELSRPTGGKSKPKVLAYCEDGYVSFF